LFHHSEIELSQKYHAKYDKKNTRRIENIPGGFALPLGSTRSVSKNKIFWRDKRLSSF